MRRTDYALKDVFINSESGRNIVWSEGWIDGTIECRAESFEVFH